MVLHIFIRKDLKMRKGKMAAQSAHAVMKLLFDVMVKTSTKMTLLPLQKEQLFKFMEMPIIKIHMVEDESAMQARLYKNLPHSIIVDSGRTEFHGVPTVTCAAQGIFSECDFSEIYVPAMYGKDIKAKQIFVYTKDTPLSKEAACELSVLSCLKYLVQSLVHENDSAYFDLTTDNEFVAWITNAFAKIALSCKTLSELQDVEAQLQSQNIKYVKQLIGANTAICIEPCQPEKIDVITGKLSLI